MGRMAICELFGKWAGSGRICTEIDAQMGSGRTMHNDILAADGGNNVRIEGWILRTHSISHPVLNVRN